MITDKDVVKLKKTFTTKNDLKKLDQKTTKKFRALSQDVIDLHLSLRQDIADLRNEMREEFSKMHKELSSILGNHESRIKGLEDSVYS